MLTEKRQEEILRILQSRRSVTVQELRELLDASESTVRRDLNVMHRKGMLTKVFGGAMLAGPESVNLREDQVSERQVLHREEKRKIARYAASLIEPEDFVYLDAGTTTGAMIPYLTEKSAVFVTNAVSHALGLVTNGFRVILIGGELKAATEAIVGNEAFLNLQKFNFTKGFWGANGADKRAGYTTPDINEAMVKKCAMKHTQEAYVLCDASKQNRVCPVRFAEFSDACMITDRLLDESYRHESNVVLAGEISE